MAKLTILAAIFTVLVMIANTCAYSITNIEVDGYRDADMRALVRSTCCEQVQRQDLNQCVQYLKRASEGCQSLRRGCDEKEEQQQQAALLCCEQLRQLDDKCQCEGVVEVFKEQIQQGQLQGQGMREILRRVLGSYLRCVAWKPSTVKYHLGVVLLSKLKQCIFKFTPVEL